MKNKPTFKGIILYSLAMALCVIPTAAATLAYFPLWKESGNGKLISGFAFLLLLLAAKPIYNHFKRALSSPSVPIMWLSLFILFFALSKIADEMTVIAFVGFVSNALGSLLFKVSRTINVRTVMANEQKL